MCTGEAKGSINQVVLVGAVSRVRRCTLSQKKTLFLCKALIGFVEYMFKFIVSVRGALTHIHANPKEEITQLTL